MRLLAELAGDVPELAAAELEGVFASEGAPWTTLHRETRFLDGHADVFWDDLGRICGRLGLTHRIVQHAFDGDPARWAGDPDACCLARGVGFAVRAVRLDEAAPWRRTDIERDLGAVLAVDRRVDLRAPDVIVRAFLARDRVYVGREWWVRDPKAFEARHARHRPFSNPISLEPRLARAVANLTRLRSGQTLYDPFCGTGGILLEAAAMGLRAVGSDVDPDMAVGARRNLAHYGLDGVTFAADVADAPVRVVEHAPEGVDGIASDLPYGRSATMGRVAPARLYALAFDAAAAILRPGGRAVLGVPDAAHVPRDRPDLRLVDVLRVRVHRSLTRHFAVLERT